MLGDAWSSWCYLFLEETPSGKVGKGLGLGWVTSGELDGEVGAESTRDWVSGGKDCNGCAFDSSGEDCSVST